MAPAFQSRENRLEVMDVQGLEAAIMFPSGVGVSVEGEFLDDPAANAANVRAYNRWVQDDWGFAFKNRIFTPANVPLANIDVMVAELDRTLAEGARTVMLPPGPLNGRSPADPYYDPFWARIQEVGRARGRAPELHAATSAPVPSTATTRTRTTSTASTRSSGSRTGVTVRSWRRSRR